MMIHNKASFICDISGMYYPDSKICVANIWPTWVLSALGGPHVSPMNLAIRVLQGVLAISVSHAHTVIWYTQIPVFVWGCPSIGLFLSYLMGWICFALHIEAQAKWMPFRRQHFLMHFLNGNVCFLIEISLKFVNKGPINSIPALV